ncbi:MAG: carboxymuconolactone decarboxylase family protein [Nitrospinota bacterium]
MRELPPTLKDLQKRHPRIWEAHEDLSKACLEAGPLERKTALLVRIGIAASSRKRTPLATHIRLALEEGVTPDEIEHAILLTTTTQGLSTMMQALQEWHAILSSQ